MYKDYNLRNSEKQILDIWNVTLYPKFKEIWYIKLGINIWDEENWKWWFIRPVLVIKKIGSLYFVIPMSTKIKHTIFHYQVHTSSITKKSSVLLLSQWKVVDRKRFYKHI